MNFNSLIKFKEIINGREYTSYGTPNAAIAKAISKKYEGYALSTETKFNVSKIYVQSRNYFNKTSKFIGTLIYNFDTDSITYIKHCSTEELQKFIKYGVINFHCEVIKALKLKDKITIEEPTQRPKGKNVYTITFNKLSNYQAKKQGYEYTYTIPAKEFIKTWVKAEPKQKRRFTKWQY